jgi:hypothetical protein
MSQYSHARFIARASTAMIETRFAGSDQDAAYVRIGARSEAANCRSQATPYGIANWKSQMAQFEI